MEDQAEALRGLVDAAAWERLQSARAGKGSAHLLRLGDLSPGDVGVVEAVVVQVHPTRSFARKSGGTGEMAKVTLADPTGEADLVLWGDELACVRPGGALVPGARVRLRGPAVKASRVGAAAELGLGSAILERLEDDGGQDGVDAEVLSVGPTRVLEGGAGPGVRFQADAVVATPEGPRRVALEGELLRAVRSSGAGARLAGLLRHPAVDGWLLAGPAARVGQALPPSPSHSGAPPAPSSAPSPAPPIR